MQESVSFQRRKESRYRVPMDVEILPARAAGSEVTVDAHVIDVSRHGVRFEARPGLLEDGTQARIGFRFTASSRATPILRLSMREAPTENSQAYVGTIRFDSESDRRKFHGFLSSLKPDQLVDRRGRERRSNTSAWGSERRLGDRRRNFGIFTEAVSFASRAPAWQAEYMLYRPTESTLPSRIVSNGRELISFGSNDYLGLSHHPQVKEAAIRAIERYGTCSGSRVLTGTMDLHRDFERELARFKGTETAIVFAGGYLTNVALLTALFKEGDVAFLDEKAHASIIDGCVYSRAKLVPFRHNSAEDLEAKIRRVRAWRSLVIVDGVYSLEGDLSPLRDIKDVATRYNIPLMVDDAHGLGVMGKTGAGTAEHFGLKGQIDLDMGTLSGALGGVGGFVACKKYLADYIRDFSRGFRFTTSLPPATIAGLVESLRILLADEVLRVRLWANMKQLKTGLTELGYQISATESAILSIPIGHEQTTWEVVRLLEHEGIYVSPFIRPAVKRGQARIRLTVNSAHTEDDIVVGLDVFRRVKPEIEAKIQKGKSNLGG